MIEEMKIAAKKIENKVKQCCKIHNSNPKKENLEKTKMNFSHFFLTFTKQIPVINNTYVQATNQTCPSANCASLHRRKHAHAQGPSHPCTHASMPTRKARRNPAPTQACPRARLFACPLTNLKRIHFILLLSSCTCGTLISGEKH